MRRSSNIVVAIVSALILLIAAAIFTINISRSTLWKDDESFSTIEAANEIKIYDNDYGSPHIIAENDNDMFFAVGFTHARDRLWQMEYNRRLASGRLSEIFGGKSLESDKFMRSLELEPLARRIYSKMGKRSRLILKSYSAGVNEFISRYKSKFSYEFGALSFEPEPWRPEDCILIQRLFALELSRAFWTEPHLTALADKIGPQMTAALLPNENQGPYFLENGTGEGTDTAAPANSISYNSANKNHNELTASSDDALNKYISTLSAAANSLGIVPGSIGSNAWACNKNSDRRAILAADPHNAISLPAKWYEMHVTSAGINTIGLTLPGFPLFFIGRNDYYAFGFASYSGDDCDFYFEKFDESGKKIILPDGSKRDITGPADTIKIRGAQPLIYYTRRGRHSRLLTDVDFTGKTDFAGSAGSPIKSFVRKRALSFRWTGMEISDEVEALYRINFGKKWQDFTTGASQWTSPALNFVYADKSGNIGLSAAGKLPERAAGERRFAYGYMQPDWIGLSRLPNPNVYNPAGSLTCATNNAPFRSAIGYFEPSSRALRIRESIDSIADYTLRDAQLTQADVGSPYAREIIRLTVPELNARVNGMTFLEKSALHRFKTWDQFISASSVASTIYSAFIHKLIVNIFRDELGEYGFERYTSLASLALRKLPEELSKDSSIFIDDKTTEKRELKQNIIFKSFRDAVDMCRELYKSENIWDWRYGKLHKLTLQNGNGIGLNYKTGFKPVELELSGSFSTINCAAWDINKPFAVTLASSARFVADMRDSVVYMSIPGGASGDAMSPNYLDQIQLWKNGGYLRIPFYREPGAGYKLSVTIKPKA